MSSASRQGRIDIPGATRGADSQRRRILTGVLTLFFLCLITAPFFFNSISHKAPQPRDGEVSYADWGPLARPVELGGDWKFQWLAPPLSSTGTASAPSIMRVPGLWAGKPAPDGTTLPAQGRALYTLTIHDLPAGQYALYVPSIYGGNRVFINDRLVSQHGIPGNDASSTRYLIRAHHIPLTTQGGDVRIAIDIAAFLHRDSGMDTTPVLGLESPMERWSAVHWAQEVLFHTALVLLAIYGLVVFLNRTNDRASLYFAMSCFLFTMASAVLGWDNLLTLIFPDLSFRQMLMLLYLPTEMSLGFFLAYAHLLFPAESPRWAYRTLLGLIVALVVAQAISFATSTTLVASEVNRGLFAILLLVFSYLVVVLVRAAIRGRDGAIVFLLGIGIFFVSLIMLAVVAYGVATRDQVIGMDFTTYGVLVLLFSHIIVLAERWSLAMRATERTNEDLRQLLDVNLAITSEVELEPLLAKIVRATSKILNADRSSLLMYDEKRDELQSIVAEGVTGENIRFPATSGIAGHALRTGETVNVPDAYADPRFMREMDTRTGYRTRNLLSMPITTRDGKHIGIMQALNRITPGPFDAEDEARMGAFAAQAAVAIENARLFKEVVASRNYNESILRSMSNGVITLDRDGRVTKLNDAACAIMGVSAEAAVDADWRTVVARDNPAILGEIESVATSGQAKSLLDTDILTLSGDRISANVSIVPLMGDTRQEGLLVLIDDISQGKRLEGAMRRFMTQKVVDQVLSQRDELLFGTACEASVLFADIRNFTTMSEALAPRATVDMLNEIFTDLFEAVAESDGVLDKFIGDAVMAVYGAPISSGRDPQNAVASAIRMQEMMAAINIRRGARGEPPLRLGVGIASGELIAGTIGSPKRMDYTVIGDSVNLAARLQDITKFYHADIVVCEATAAANPDVAMRELDLIRVRGRSRPARIFEILSSHTAPDWHQFYKQGREHLSARRWQEAVTAFDAALAAAPSDWASTIMRDRAQSAMETPPHEEWDGVWLSDQTGAA